MPAEILSKTEIAQRAGVGRGAVTKACRLGGPLHEALVGDRIDANHPAAQKFLGITPPKRKSPAPEMADGDGAEVDTTLLPGLKGIEHLAHMTLHEICEKFGTERNLKDWLDARYKQAKVQDAELSILQQQGVLVERERVQTHVFGAFDALHRRLLTDLIQTASEQLYAAARAGTPISEARHLLRSLVTAQLKPVRNQLRRGLHDADE